MTNPTHDFARYVAKMIMEDDDDAFIHTLAFIKNARAVVQRLLIVHEDRDEEQALAIATAMLTPHYDETEMKQIEAEFAQIVQRHLEGADPTNPDDDRQ